MAIVSGPRQPTTFMHSARPFRSAMRLRRSSTSFALAGASPWSTWPGHPGTFDLVHELEEKGASLRVLEPAIDTGGPMGRMVLTVLGMVAEMELGFIRDRQRAGIEAAKAKGIYKGRPVTFDRARIVSLRKEGMGATEIAKAVGCKRGNVYKALKAVGLN